MNQKIHWPPKKPTGPQKTCNDPNVFAAGIYDFTREVAHFCTLGLYITKNKYELTLPSEFCRFPVKIMAAYEALKKKNCGGPTASKRHAGQRAHSLCQGLESQHQQYNATYTWLDISGIFLFIPFYCNNGK